MPWRRALASLSGAEITAQGFHGGFSPSERQSVPVSLALVPPRACGALRAGRLLFARPGVELSKAIVTLRRGKVRAQPLTNIACNVRQSSRRPRVRRHQRSTRTAAQCARSATPDLPVTDHILTPSTDARRPRCASPPDPRPTSFLQCALFFPAPNRVTTVTSTAKCPPLHRQRTGRRPHQYSPYNADRPVVSPILAAPAPVRSRIDLVH